MARQTKAIFVLTEDKFFINEEHDEIAAILDAGDYTFGRILSELEHYSYYPEVIEFLVKELRSAIEEGHNDAQSN